MKKLSTFLLAFFTILGANAWTVKFTNPLNWSSVNVYTFNDETEGAWPGKPMTKSGSEWTFTGSGSPKNIIFNNGNSGGNNQTANLTLVDGATYDMNGPISGGNQGGNTGGGTVTGDWWVNVGGPFNGNDYYNDGKQPDAQGIATFTGLAIGTSGIKVKTWDGSNDVYYISDNGTIATDTWVQLYQDMYDASPSTIVGAQSGSVYTLKFNILTNQVYVSTNAGGGNQGGNQGGTEPDQPTTPPAGDSSVTWVNLGGPYNGYNYFDDGQQPDAQGIATFTDQAIGTSGFKVKTWNESVDVYYISETGTIPVGTWFQLYEDIYDAPESTIEGAEAGSVYTVQFNVLNNQILVTLNGGGNQGGNQGGTTDPEPDQPTTPPAGDSSVTWVNLGGPYNGYNYFDDGQQPDAQGIATFTDQAIGTSGFKVKTWNESGDVYSISETGTIPVGTWFQLYEDIYDAPESTIEGAEAGSVYTVQFNVLTNQILVTLNGGGNQGGNQGGTTDPEPDQPTTPPAGDSSVTWVNLGGPYNGYNYFDDGQQPDAQGIATFTDQAIGTRGFKVKTWNESVDVYYISETGTIPTGVWFQLYEDIYDAPESTIEGAESNSVYTVKFNVLTNQVYVALKGAPDTNAIESIDAEDAEAVYFNLQGVRVDNPAKGIYLKVTGNKTEKVIR